MRFQSSIPAPVFALAEQLFPGRGGELSNEWRTRQFEYTWLRVAAGHYADFWHVTQDALEFAASKLSLELGPDKRDKLMNAYLELKPWLDVPRGARVAEAIRFSAGVPVELHPCDARCECQERRSCRQVRTNHQHGSGEDLQTGSPRVSAGHRYAEAAARRNPVRRLAGWDAAGAKLFGYPTFWLNRQKLPAEKLDATPDGVGESFTQLLQFLKV